MKRRTRTRKPARRKSPAALLTAYACARAADDKIGEDTVVLDVRALTSIADYLIITTATSPPHAKSVAESMEDAAKAAGGSVHHKEGDHLSPWLLLDLSDVIVHIFAAETRSNYDLERLWADAPRVRWRARAKKPRGTIK